MQSRLSRILKILCPCLAAGCLAASCSAAGFETTAPHSCLKRAKPGASSKPRLILQIEPRYAWTESDTGQPTWLLPSDRTSSSHYQTRRFRLTLTGQLGDDVLYYIKAIRDSGLSDFEMHDYYMTYSRWRPVHVTVGQFKTPAERMLITSDMQVPLFERPRASKVLSTDRDVGICVWNDAACGGRLGWWAGLFQGNGKNTSESHNTFLTIARLEWQAHPSLGIGASYAYNNNCSRTRFRKFLKKNGDPYGWLSYYSAYAMDEETWCIDALWRQRNFSLWAGYMRKNLSSAMAPGPLPHASDWYIVGRWQIPFHGSPDKLDVVFGFDRFDPNSAVTDSLDCDFWTIGLNYRPRGLTRGWTEQWRLQFQHRNERGPDVSNDTVILQYERVFNLPLE